MWETPRVSNKRILVLANFDVGLYKFRRHLLETLLRDGNEVFISLPNGEYVPALEKMGCRFMETAVERRGMNPIRDLSLLRRYQAILREVKPDFVLTYTIKPNIYGGFACRMAKIPYAVNITGLGTAIEQGGTLCRLVFTMYRAALKKAKVVFFENRGNCETLVRAGVVREDKTYVLRGAGIDTKEYPSLPYGEEGAVHFLFVGRIMKEKGVDELFEAMRLLKKKYGDSVICDVVGLFEEAYEARMDELQKDGIIVFHGYQSDVRPFYEKAHCVVLPSYHEGMSNVLLEAAASGRAIITTDIYGCREAVTDGESGFLVPPKDAEALYEKMCGFMERTPAEREQMGKKGRVLAETLFEKQTVVAETLSQLMK